MLNTTALWTLEAVQTLEKESQVPPVNQSDCVK